MKLKHPTLAGVTAEAGANWRSWVKAGWEPVDQPATRTKSKSTRKSSSSTGQTATGGTTESTGPGDTTTTGEQA